MMALEELTLFVSAEPRTRCAKEPEFLKIIYQVDEIKVPESVKIPGCSSQVPSKCVKDAGEQLLDSDDLTLIISSTPREKLLDRLDLEYSFTDLSHRPILSRRPPLVAIPSTNAAFNPLLK